MVSLSNPSDPRSHPSPRLRNGSCHPSPRLLSAKLRSYEDKNQTNVGNLNFLVEHFSFWEDNNVDGHRSKPCPLIPHPESPTRIAKTLNVSVNDLLS
jgi:hypothetical protein